jgi:hypothetical protein
MKLMLLKFVSNGREEVGQASIFHLIGVDHNELLIGHTIREKEVIAERDIFIWHSERIIYVS